MWVSCGRPYPWDTFENQLSPSCPNSSHSSHVQDICITSWEAYSRATRENSFSFQLPWVFTLSLSLTQPIQINPTWNTGYIRLNKITIKFGMKLKPTLQFLWQLFLLFPCSNDGILVKIFVSASCTSCNTC